VEALSSEVEHLARENEGHRSEIKNQHLKIQDLEISNKKLKRSLRQTSHGTKQH
jgi:hypothetical protein